MATASISNTVSCLGKSFTATRTASADGAVVKDPTLAAAKTGTLTTRTDANTGVLTMASGHGIISTDRVDVYWDGGARYGMTATVATNAVTVDGGGGDDLPDVSTAITAMVPQLEDFVVDAADLAALFVGSTVPAWVVFYESDDTLIKAVYVGSSTDAYRWDEDDDAASPFAENCAKAYFSHGSAAGSKQVNAVALAN